MTAIEPSSFDRFIKQILTSIKIDFSGKKSKILDDFLADEDNMVTFNQIAVHQEALISKLMNKAKVFDIIDQHLQIPNGTVGKPYEYKFNINNLGKGEITFTQINDLKKYGLIYDNETETLSGIPILNGDFKISLQFKIKGENDDSPLNSKPITLVINADPKSLWKNIASDEGRDDEWKKNNYWKPDNVEDFQTLGNKHIVVASKRGRSHANVGSFRDDDFAYANYKDTGWSIVCVADGAGSAKLSRQGSKVSCESIVEYFAENFKGETLTQFDRLLKEHRENSEENPKELNVFIYDNLGKGALAAHKKLEELANKLEVPLKDLHSTLIFALFKKYEFGYAILTFGVGDCPIGLLNENMTEIKLMNWLDVGEFGGGTRFITMPEIFNSDKFPTRFGFKLIDDFSFLILMTDGIYDPKFEVEANLEKIEKWKAFIEDLKGQNEDQAKVEFIPGNKAIAKQLSEWMDFWSPGNHDDRTLAIIF